CSRDDAILDGEKGEDMGTSTFEGFVRRLFGDQEFRSGALRDPERVMAEYRLDGAEKAAARKLCQRLVTPEGVMGSPAGPFGWWVKPAATGSPSAASVATRRSLHPRAVEMSHSAALARRIFCCLRHLASGKQGPLTPRTCAPTMAGCSR